MRRALPLLILLVCAPAAVAKLDGTQWKDAETRWHDLFKDGGQSEPKAALIRLVAEDGEPRSFTLVAEGVVLEAGYCGRIAERKSDSLTKLQSFLGKKDNDWRPGEEAEMLRLQGEVGALERQLVDEERILKQLVAAATGGNEAFHKVVLAKCAGHKDWAARAAGARLAGSVPDEASSKALLEGLDKEKDPRVRLAALESLATAPGTIWYPFAIARLLDPEWGVQLVAARIAGARTIGKAIPDLITALVKCTPRVGEEINASLKKLTGQNFDPYAEVWAKWWAANRLKFGDDGKPLEPFKEGGVRPDDAAFYGIKVRSDKVVFVIDISGSMKEEKKTPGKPGAVTGDSPAPVAALSGPKVEIAKIHLKRAIEALPSAATFNIIAFNHAVLQWQPKMMTASKEVKEQAYAWIREFPAKGSTYIDGALRIAFKLAGLGAYDKNYPGVGVDTIFVLSDGAPTDNGFPQSKDMAPDEILQHVREWNLQKRVVINCVGIDNVVVGIKFLKDLATENGGTYVDG